jgi:hypothetical protein
VNTLADVSILEKAERELGAFLSAVAELAGPGFLDRASQTWIAAVEESECLEADHEKFFREVTMRAAAQFQKPKDASLAGEGLIVGVPLFRPSVESGAVIGI